MDKLVDLFYEGSWEFWLPAMLIWLVVMFIVGFMKYTYKNGTIKRRGRYIDNTLTLMFASSFCVIAALNTWRSTGQVIYNIFDSKKGNTTLAVFSVCIALVVWVLYGFLAYNVGRAGSIIRWNLVYAKYREASISEMMDRVIDKYCN